MKLKLKQIIVLLFSITLISLYVYLQTFKSDSINQFIITQHEIDTLRIQISKEQWKRQTGRDISNNKNLMYSSKTLIMHIPDPSLIDSIIKSNFQDTVQNKTKIDSLKKILIGE